MALSVPMIYFPAVGFLILGCLFHIIAMASPNWIIGKSHYGLWTTEICGTGYYAGLCFELRIKGIDLAMRAFSVIALLTICGSGLAAILFVPFKTRQKTLAYLIAVGCLISFLASAITDVLFRVKFISGLGTGSVHFGYSYYLSSIATSLFLFSSVLGFIMACKLGRNVSTPGTVYYNPQGTVGQPQYIGAQNNSQTGPGQRGQQYAAQPYNPQTGPGQRGQQYAAQPYNPQTVPGEHGQQFAAQPYNPQTDPGQHGIQFAAPPYNPQTSYGQQPTGIHLQDEKVRLPLSEKQMDNNC